VKRPKTQKKNPLICCSRLRATPPYLIVERQKCGALTKLKEPTPKTSSPKSSLDAQRVKMWFTYEPYFLNLGFLHETKLLIKTPIVRFKVYKLSTFEKTIQLKSSEGS
jgi:hypothetical protein